MNQHLDIIKTEFTKQSTKFHAYMANEDKEQFNKNAIQQIHLSGNENVLEVAAGTCAFGRMIAPHVAQITELDATKAMLSIGKKENEKIGIENVKYVIASAEQLPFADNVFDIVVSRLAFHHFPFPELIFAEMKRVLKTNGKLVIADMIARNQPYRILADQYEKLRDPSHVHCLTKEELYTLAKLNHMKIDHCSLTKIPMSLIGWMNLTDTPLEIKEQVINDMKREINGGQKTGFEPYLKNDQIMFDHQWILFICRDDDENQ